MPEPEGINKSLITEAERVGLQRTAEFASTGSAYALLHATRPSTISFSLASSPLALLSWIGEKFLQWTDDDTTPSLNTILESVTLYWFTETFPHSIYPYRELFTPGVIGAHENPKWHINKPFGFSWFPKEIAPVPKVWVETTGNLVWWKEHTRGGHFAAVEQSEVLLGDLKEFIAAVWTH
jgi:microsomal epoxide hydrolase